MTNGDHGSMIYWLRETMTCENDIYIYIYIYILTIHTHSQNDKKYSVRNNRHFLRVLLSQG